MSIEPPHITGCILKIAGRCNINCSYCYMYNLADQTHTLQPKRMAESTLEGVFSWIARYTDATAQTDFHVSLHGGEPLLAGKHYVRWLALLRDRTEQEFSKEISLGLTTNGLLLDDEWLSLFEEHRISFGISIDGPAEYHDRFRLDHQGRGTHQEVETKIRWVLNHPVGQRRFSGSLCVIHPEMDGRRLVEYFYMLGLSKVDLLLPDQNYLHGSGSYPRPTSAPTYGKVLSNAYRSWRSIDDPGFRIRKFSTIIAAFLGETPTLDSLGTGPITVFTVETSGEVEAVDTMKLCGDGFTKTGRHITEISPEAVHEIPLIRLGLQKARSIPAKCGTCRFVAACGGGYLPHRFHGDAGSPPGALLPLTLGLGLTAAQGFDRETVYCEDMLHLCDVIHHDLSSEVGRAQARSRGSSRLQPTGALDC